MHARLSLPLLCYLLFSLLTITPFSSARPRSYHPPAPRIRVHLLHASVLQSLPIPPPPPSPLTITSYTFKFFFEFPLQNDELYSLVASVMNPEASITEIRSYSVDGPTLLQGIGAGQGVRTQALEMDLLPAGVERGGFHVEVTGPPVPPNGWHLAINLWRDELGESGDEENFDLNDWQ